MSFDEENDPEPVNRPGDFTESQAQRQSMLNMLPISFFFQRVAAKLFFE